MDTRIVEINGVKLEIDLREAKTIESYKIGDLVRVLTKEYNGFTPHNGVIVAFDEFKNLPTIVVCYVENSYSGGIKFAYINADSPDVEIAPASLAIAIDEGLIMDKLNREIERKKDEVAELERKKNFFLSHFAKYFKQHFS